MAQQATKRSSRSSTAERKSVKKASSTKMATKSPLKRKASSKPSLKRNSPPTQGKLAKPLHRFRLAHIMLVFALLGAVAGGIASLNKTLVYALPTSNISLKVASTGYFL